MQLLVLVPAFLVLSVPAGVQAGTASFTVAQVRRPEANPPFEAPHRMLELPTRALAAAPPRIVPYVAIVPVPLTLPPAAEGRMKSVRSIAPHSAESAPRSSRAPPAA